MNTLIERLVLEHFAELEDPHFGEFKRLLTKHVAPLADRLGFFVGRMGKDDREAFIATTLAQAWVWRASLHARNGSLMSWWTNCAKAVMKKRTSWMFHYSTHSERVSSREFVRTIQ